MIKDRTEKWSSELESVASQIQEGLRRGKYTVAELQEALMDKTRNAAEKTDSYVHENAWAAVGVAAGVGFLAGMIATRQAEDLPPESRKSAERWELFSGSLPLFVVSVYKAYQAFKGLRR